MPSSIKSEVNKDPPHCLLTSSNNSSTMSTAHPIQQLNEVIKKADKAEPPGRAKDLLKPIQDNIKVREQHHADCLKEKDSQVLALKLELAIANLNAKEYNEDIIAIKGELRGAKRDVRRLENQTRSHREMLLGLETEKTAWMKENCGKIAELEDVAKKLEAARADLQIMVTTLNTTIQEQKIDLFDLKAKGIAQRGEIHFLKKDIERLKDKVELNRTATEWLAQNGPSLKDDFFSLRNEVAGLKAKGSEMARLMIKGAREWEKTHDGVGQVVINSETRDSKEDSTSTGQTGRAWSAKRRSGSMADDDNSETQSRPEDSAPEKRRRIARSPSLMDTNLKATQAGIPKKQQSEVQNSHSSINPGEKNILLTREPRSL
ncbi:hypothetical protein BKA65DRAFT_473152 [Rhexocercosporidium sp. MPI-PUGE-AT-0058]|nr:hypothetical protein BKA65DRAFT_473152 [Rhexocercosporidium sp. MPI-PUGE-AT-0058]